MIDTPAAPPASISLGKAMGAHWKLILAEGILLLILGVVALAAPFVAGVATALLLGWLFLFSGIAGLVFTYQSRRDPGFWWALLSAVIALAAGLLLLLNPVGGLFSLTFVLIAYFIVDGVLTILLAFEQRKALDSGWQWWRSAASSTSSSPAC